MRIKLLIQLIGPLVLGVTAGVHATPLDHLRSASYGGAWSDRAYGIAVDAEDNLYVTGSFEHSADMGGGALVGGAKNAFLAKYDNEGNHVWSRGFGAANSAEAHDVVVDDTGCVIITGSFTNNVDFGGGDLVNEGYQDVFLAKYDPEGVHMWSLALGSWLPDEGLGLATDASNSIYLCGFDRYEWPEPFVAKYDSEGVQQWIQRDPWYGRYSSVASDGSSVYAVGTIGERELIDGDFHMYYDAIIVKYDTSGAYQWSMQHGAGGFKRESFDVVGIDPAGNVVVGGYYHGAVDFGGGTLPLHGDQDVVVAKYGITPTGTATHIWSRGFGSAGHDVANTLAIDPSGAVWVGGEMSGGLDFGGGPRPSAGARDAYLVNLDSDGNYIGDWSWGGIGLDATWDVVFDSEGNVTIAAWYEQTVDFGGGGMTALGGADIALATYAVGPLVATILRAYRAEPTRSGIEIIWELIEAGQGMSFSVLRAETGRDDFEPVLNPEIVRDDLTFRFVDGTSQPGKAYRYRVAVVDDDGYRILFETQAVGAPSVPLSLGPNYPDPFGVSTRIPFQIDQTMQVTLGIYDVSGRLVRRLVEQTMGPGSYSEVWDGRDMNGRRMASGVYFYRMRAGKTNHTRKMVFLK